MTEQNTFAISELQRANNDNAQAQHAILREMEMMQIERQRVNIQSLLQLIKHQGGKLSKDEVLKVIFSRSGLGREGEMSFLSPNRIAELISAIGGVYKPKTVIDICCGSGNVLSYFKSLQTVKGIDIDTEIVQLAQYINPDADIVAINTLELHVNTGNQKSIFDDDIKYDLVIGDLPFGARTSDRQPLEIGLIKKGLELLNDNGVAIFIVPESLLVNSSSTEFRHQLLSDFALDMVISLPIGVFPHTGIKKSVLVLRNGNSNQDVFMPVFEDNSTLIADNFNQHKGSFYLSISKITNRFDRNHYSSLEAIEEILNGHELIKLSDVSEIIKGRQLDRNTFKKDGRYLVFNKKDRDGNNFFIDNIIDDRCVLRPDDIVIPLFIMRQNDDIFIHTVTDVETVITDLHAIIRPTKCYKEYLETYLQTQDWKILLQPHLKISTMQPRLDVRDLQNIEIPHLSPLKLNELVSKTLKLNNKTKYHVLESFEYLEQKKYEQAKICISQAFKDTDSEESQHKYVYLENINNVEGLHKKDQELEDMMSMFAHKFRSPLDAIIYNTTHENQVKLYTEAAQTMRGLLNIFSIISTDAEILKDKIKQDRRGSGRLATVFSKTLDMILLHLLSVSGAEKIQQHYMAYAKAHGLCDAQVSYKTWCEDFFELEQVLQAEWEQSFALLLNQSATLEQRLAWLEQHFFKLELIGFERADIQFKEYGVTESLLTILLNEILVNAFKYYSSASKQPVELEWTEREGYQVLICRNPSIRSERTIIKGSHKGHTFLSTLARKTGSAFTKPTPQDDFVVEFGIPDELLISK